MSDAVVAVLMMWGEELEEMEKCVSAKAEDRI